MFVNDLFKNKKITESMSQQDVTEAHGPYSQKKASDLEKIQKAKEREKKNAPGQLRRALAPSKQRYRDSSIEYFSKLDEQDRDSYLDSKPYNPPRDAEGRSYLDSKPYNPPRDAEGRSYLDPAPYNPPRDAQGKSYLDFDPMQSQMDPKTGQSYLKDYDPMKSQMDSKGKSYFDTGVDEDFDDKSPHNTYIQSRTSLTSRDGVDDISKRVASLSTDRHGNQRVRAIDTGRNLGDEVTINTMIPKGVKAKIVPQQGNATIDEGSVQDRLHRRHQELRKKRGAPDPDYYKELKKSYDIENDQERVAQQAEIKKKYKVAEGISVLDSDYDLDQMILTLDIEGTKKYFTYWDYDENFENAERKDVFDQLQDQPWYASLDHPTKMEILDAAYKAIRGEEPSEYKPTVGDEPLDEAGPFSYGAKKPRKGSVADLAAKKRKEQEKNKKPIEPRDQMVGTARVVTNEDVERYLEEMRRAGYDIVTERATLCPECGGPAFEDQMLAEKQDACYHKVKSRYKVWPSAYASGALVRCRKVGAKNWGNKSKK
jgi:hypothetical protein